MTDDDASLLALYARDRSEPAFGEIVRRHLPLVYAAALRRTGGDAHRAEEVAQTVFTTVAREAERLSRHPALTGWLYTATRNAAADIRRAEQRRRQREEKAFIMHDDPAASGPAVDWEQLRPVLDEAMDELDDADREAVLLRYFKDQPFAVVAAALKSTEDAARKRVERALDKLGGLLARRGITSTGGALVVLLARQTAVAVPASVAASVASAALAGAGTGAIGAGAAGIFLMSTSKTVMAVAAVVVAIALGTAVHQARVARASAAALAGVSSERDAGRVRLAALEKRAQQTDAALAATTRTLDELRGAAAKPAESAKAPLAASRGITADYLLDHPEAQVAYLEQIALRTRQHYDRFFRSAGLSAEQQEKIVSTLSESRAAGLDVLVALRSLDANGISDAGRREIDRMGADLKRRENTGLRAVLGDDGLKTFQDYTATIRDRNVADQLAGLLYHTEEPLTATQADQLVQILAQNRFAPKTGLSAGTPMNGEFPTVSQFGRRNAMLAQADGSLNPYTLSSPVTDAALAKAQTVLQAGQLTALRRMQAQQLTEFRVAPPQSGEAATPARTGK